MFQIYNDEYAHKDVAQNMFFYQSACECHGIINETGCSVCIVPAWSPVYHFLLSFSFSFSDGFDFLFFLPILISSLSIVLFFLFSFLIFRNDWLSLFSSLFLAVLPIHLRYSGSLALEIPSLFFVLLSFILFLLLFEIRRFSFFLLFFTTFLITLQIKFENLFFIVIFGLLYLLKFYKTSKVKKKYYLLFFLILIILLIPDYLIIKHESQSSRASFDWLTSSVSFKENLINNVSQNILFLGTQHSNSFIILGLFIFGAIITYIKNKEIFFPLILIFISYFFIYSSHVFGTFSLGRADRYTTYFYIAIIIFSCYGIKQIYDFLTNSFQKKIFVSFLILFFVLNPLIYQDYILTVTPRHEEFLFLSNINIPKECIIFSEQFHKVRVATDRTVYDSFYLSDKNLLKNLDSSCLLLYDDVNIYTNNKVLISELYPFLNLEEYASSDSFYYQKDTLFKITNIK